MSYFMKITDRYGSIHYINPALILEVKKDPVGFLHNGKAALVTVIVLHPDSKIYLDAEPSEVLGDIDAHMRHRDE